MKTTVSINRFIYLLFASLPGKVLPNVKEAIEDPELYEPLIFGKHKKVLIEVDAGEKEEVEKLTDNFSNGMTTLFLAHYLKKTLPDGEFERMLEKLGALQKIYPKR
jgi:hypothetical protein